jgi:NAD(P)-dependent dehydrogenase (short-subunit alcohol dehydrogenase family)
MSMNAFNLNGKLALVTGGGSGIGYGIAKAYIDAGAKVIIIGRDEPKLAEAKSRLGDSCYYIPFDVTDVEQIPALVSQIKSDHGIIDILVNCAGTHLKKDAVDTSNAEFYQVLNVHLLSVFALTKEFAKDMIIRKSGSIILISSMSAVMGMKQVVAYSTAKTAIVGMMRALVAELAMYNIRINAIAPGWIDTPMLHKAVSNDPERKQKILNRIPGHVFGEPEDIGYAVYLASDAGKYVNGVFLPVDGGAAEAF